MSSRLTKDPYSTSFHEVDSRVSASFKAENDLKKKTEKLQKELQNSLLLHHREKVELHDFLADLRAPLGPRIVRTRKHSLGRGGGVLNSRASHKPRSLPERRLSEPSKPVNHFPASVIYDPFAWVDDGDDSDDDSHETIENEVVEVIPKITLPESVPVRKTRKSSVPRKASVFQSTSSRLPSINLTTNANTLVSSVNPIALKLDQSPHVAPEAVGQQLNNNDTPVDAEHGPPTLTLSTVANLKMGSSDLRRRIQNWCDNINEELFPFTEHGSLKKVDDNKTGQDDGKLSSEGPIPPKITVTSVINSVLGKDPTQTRDLPETPQDCGNRFQNKYSSSQLSTSHGKSSFFQPNIPEKGLPSPLSLETIRLGKSASTTEPTTPVSPQRSSSKALSLYRKLDKLTKSPRALSQVNATDLRVISKSMQSFHDCKVYRGRNSIPSNSTDSKKAFEELARAQYRLVQRQRIRAKQHGTSYDFGERVDAQIKRRSSVRWSM